jgi:hypothetical protein
MDYFSFIEVTEVLTQFSKAAHAFSDARAVG